MCVCVCVCVCACGCVCVFLQGTVYLSAFCDSLYLCYCQEAAQTLLAAAQAGSSYPSLVDKATEYMLRAEQIRSTCEYKKNNKKL